MVDTGKLGNASSSEQRIEGLETTEGEPVRERERERERHAEAEEET